MWFGTRTIPDQHKFFLTSVETIRFKCITVIPVFYSIDPLKCPPVIYIDIAYVRSQEICWRSYETETPIASQRLCKNKDKVVKTWDNKIINDSSVGV